jgi:hypothetical protein
VPSSAVADERGRDRRRGTCRPSARHQHPVLPAPHRRRLRQGQEWHRCRQGGGGGCDHNGVFAAGTVSGAELAAEPDASASLVLSTRAVPALRFVAAHIFDLVALPRRHSRAVHYTAEDVASKQAVVQVLRRPRVRGRVPLQGVRRGAGQAAAAGAPPSDEALPLQPRLQHMNFPARLEARNTPVVCRVLKIHHNPGPVRGVPRPSPRPPLESG